MAGVVLAHATGYRLFAIPHSIILLTDTALFILLISSLLVKVYRYRWVFGTVLNAFLLVSGLITAMLHYQKFSSSHFANIKVTESVYYHAIVDDEPVLRPNSAKALLNLDKLMRNDSIIRVKGNVLAYFSKDSAAELPHMGDAVWFSAIPQPVRKPLNPGEFDYASYLAVNNIFHQVYLKPSGYVIAGSGNESLLKHFAVQMRNSLLNALQRNGIRGEEFAVASALLIGYDEMLDAAQRQHFAGAGVIHILCVSGLHVGVIFLLADMLFFFLRKSKKARWLRPLLIITIIWMYAIVTGLAPSVLRASLMFSLITIGKSLNRPSNIYNTLSASAFILLLINPLMLFNLGFQLSYLAVLGIVTFYPIISGLYLPANRVSGYLWQLISVSLSAQLITAPISVFYFQQFPNYFLLANLLAIPLSGLLIYTGVLFVIVSFIPKVAAIVAMVLSFEIKLLNGAVAFIETLPGAVSKQLYLTPYALFLCYLLLFSMFTFFIFRQKKWLFVSISAIVMLTAMSAFRNVYRQSQRMILVYAVNKRTALGFIDGRRQVILADSALLENPSILNYTTASYSTKAGINKLTIIDAQKCNLSTENHMPALRLPSPGFFSFYGKRGLILTPAVKLPDKAHKLKLDFVVISSGVRANLSTLSALFPQATFICDNSNPIRNARTWAEEARKLGIEFYDLHKTGAFQIALNN